jgi:hypothetical protein
LSQSWSIFRIRIKGVLDPCIAERFGEISILPQEKDETVLVGRFPDQSALRGLLDQLWNRNLKILAVEQVETPEETGTG